MRIGGDVSGSPEWRWVTAMSKAVVAPGGVANLVTETLLMKMSDGGHFAAYRPLNVGERLSKYALRDSRPSAL